MTPWVFLVAGGLTACIAQGSESMRCGKWVVSSEVPLTELIAKCGEPVRKETQTEPIRRRNAYGAGSTVVGTTTTERWFYQRSARSITMVVTVQDGKIKSIDKAE